MTIVRFQLEPARHHYGCVNGELDMVNRGELALLTTHGGGGGAELVVIDRSGHCDHPILAIGSSRIDPSHRSSRM